MSDFRMKSTDFFKNILLIHTHKSIYETSNLFTSTDVFHEWMNEIKKVYWACISQLDLQFLYHIQFNNEVKQVLHVSYLVNKWYSNPLVTKNPNTLLYGIYAQVISK